MKKCPFFVRIQHYDMEKPIFIDLPKCQCYSLLSKLPMKIKKSEIFAVNNDPLK